MRYFTRLFFIIMLTFSCSYGVEMKIENKSSQTVKNVKVTNGFNSVLIDSIRASFTKDIFIDFKKNNTRVDGGYEINYMIGKQKFNKFFGYYSNGIPSNNTFVIKIKKDTIITKEEFN